MQQKDKQLKIKLYKATNQSITSELESKMKPAEFIMWKITVEN